MLQFYLKQVLNFELPGTSLFKWKQTRNYDW